MRILLLFWFLVGVLRQGVSQNLDIATHLLEDNPKYLVNVNSKCFYLDDGCRSLIGMSASGQVTFSVALPSYIIDTYHRLIKTNDNCIALIGTSIGCETYNHLNNRNFIVKVDTNGVIKFQTLIQFFYSGALIDEVVDFTQHSDSSYYIVSDSLLYHYSKTGTFMSKINTGFKNIRTVITLNNGNLLINGRLNNILKNLEVTTTASIITQQNAANPIVKFIQTPSGKIFGLTTINTLESFSGNLTSINTSTTYINPISKFNDFIIRNDSLFITGNNGVSNTPLYLITDQNFNPLCQTPTTYYKNVIPAGIAIDSHNRVNIVTKDLPAIPGRLSSSSHYQFPINGTFISKLDIGVATLSLVSGYKDSNGFSGVCNLEVTVKNYTGDTIKSFYLNYHGFFTFTCQHVSFHKLYNVTIAPYGKVVVQTGDINFEISSMQNICIFTTVPNSSTDCNLDNDALCSPVLLTIGIVEKTPDNSNLRVFPNPFSQEFNIQSDVELTGIKIYDITGRLVKESGFSGTEIGFNSTDLNSGIYLLKIETEKGIRLKKLVKQ